MPKNPNIKKVMVIGSGLLLLVRLQSLTMRGLRLPFFERGRRGSGFS
jgi:hypothetical protein